MGEDDEFQLAAIPDGEWQQSLSGPVVPSLYHSMGEMTIHASIHCLQFGHQGTEQLQRRALSLLE